MFHSITESSTGIRRRMRRSASAAFALIMFTPWLAAAQWHVDPAGVAGAACTAVDPCPLIADAVAVSAAGDTISVATGTYFESGIVIPHSLTIQGDGMLSTTVDGSAADSVFIVTGGSDLLVRRLTIQNGDAGVLNGGAIRVDDGNLVVVGARLLNSTALAGGAIAQQSTGLVLVSGSIIQGNTGNATGGGIWCSGCVSVRVIASFVTGNVAGSTGGGIHVVATDLDVWASSVSNNNADAGGGIYALSSAVRVWDAGVSLNEADNGDGGGLFVTGTLDLERSTVAENTAVIGNGGGLFMVGGGALAMGNSTISQNEASCGGGLSLVDDIYDGPTAIIGTTTLYGNGSTFGACGEQIQTGLLGTKELYNSIVTGSAGSQCNNPLDGGNHNLLDDATCDTGGATFNLGVVTLLESNLAFNGGLTRTHAILDPLSTAVDAGNNGACLNPGTGAALVIDQRGQPRPDPTGGICDIGAYEYQ